MLIAGMGLMVVTFIVLQVVQWMDGRVWSRSDMYIELGIMGVFLTLLSLLVRYLWRRNGPVVVPTEEEYEGTGEEEGEGEGWDD